MGFKAANLHFSQYILGNDIFTPKGVTSVPFGVKIGNNTFWCGNSVTLYFRVVPDYQFIRRRLIGDWSLSNYSNAGGGGILCEVHAHVRGVLNVIVTQDNKSPKRSVDSRCICILNA